MNNLKTIFGALCLVCLLGGLTFGFIPVTDMETSLRSFGDKVDCGSAFMKNDDGLTEFGKSSCEAAGLSRNRTFAIVLIVLAVGFGIASVSVSSDSGSTSPSSDPLPPPSTGTGPPTPGGAPPVTLSSQLADLDAAHDQGLLSDHEYSEARKRMLGL